MLYPEKRYKMKDGREAVFRSPKEEDAREMLDYLKTTAGETPFLLRTPEECNQTEEHEIAWLQNSLRDDNEVMIVCEVDGKIAGNCQINFLRRIKSKHRASIGIALLSRYWNLGIGTAMFEEMIRLAKERGGITQLELEVMEGNSRAIHLYEKMGFQIAAARPNAFQMEDGSLRNEYIMVRAL